MQDDRSLHWAHKHSCRKYCSLAHILQYSIICKQTVMTLIGLHWLLLLFMHHCDNLFVLTVHRCLLTYFYTLMRPTLYSLLKAGKKHLAQQFSFTYRYKDDVLSLKNTKFVEYLEFIYSRELEIKETTETAASSSYLDCYFYIDTGKLLLGFTTNGMTTVFPLLTFHSWAVISLLHQHTAFTYHS